jgi:hypothetical protein
MSRTPSAMLASLGAIALTAAVLAATPAVTWPDTPAGRAARAYFAMLADGSEGAIRGFETAYRTASALAQVPLEERVRRGQDLRFRLGDVTPIALLPAPPNHLRVTAESSKSGAFELEFEMDGKEPAKLVGIMVRLGEGGDVPAQPLTAEHRAKVVAEVARAVDETYVYPERGRAMAQKVRETNARGGYEAINSERQLAERLTEDLRSVTHDLHLGVRVAPADGGHGALQPMPGGGDAARDNYGFKSAELMAGNIGVVRFDGFIGEPAALQTADAAMAFLKHADAIIFDLRTNSGGDPVMIRRLASYFLSQRTHLNSMIDRSGAMVDDFWTEDVPGTRFPDDLPVFVLTSSDTFSCAEEFTYDLKSLKRATIVGETTGGGAHPVQIVRIDDRFIVRVPFLRALNPVTKTNWEGVGVEPDVKTGAAEALGKALELARAAVTRHHSP